jgi:RimJ/RimL family protein N-acetyltransferase
MVATSAVAGSCRGSGPEPWRSGYWVDARFARRGIATAAAALLADTALSLEGIRRVEIHCDETNVASAAIPERLGYSLDRAQDVDRHAPSETGRDMVWILERD